MARFGAIPTQLDIPAGNFVRRNAGDSAFEAASDVVIDGDFASGGLMRRGTNPGDYSIVGGSSAIDTVEITLTDDATHMATSAAIYAAIASAVSAEDLWDRTGTTLSPKNAGDNLEIDGGRITVNTIDEYGAGVGVAIDSLLIRDGNIGTSSSYQGIAYLSSWDLRVQATNAYTYARIYSTTDSYGQQELIYRYGGTIVSPVAVSSNSYIKYERSMAYDGTIEREVARYSTKVKGAVATDNIAGEHWWLVRGAGAAAPLNVLMRLDENGLSVDNINEYNTGVGITIDTGLLKDNSIGDTTHYWNYAYIDHLTLKDPAGSVAATIEATSTDNLYIRAGTGLTYLTTASINNTLRVLNNALGATYYTSVTGAGIEIRTNNVQTFEANQAGIKTDVIAEVRADQGVTVDTMLLKDYVISCPDGSASNGQPITLKAGDPNGVGNDGGSVTIKAGNALAADSASTPGGIYLMPGNPYQTSVTSQVFLGDNTYNADVIGIQSNGSQTDVDLTLSTKGAGAININSAVITFGTGAAGTLPNDDTETTVVAYDTTTGLLSYRTVASIGDSNHALLSATHSDTANVAVSRGNIIYGDSLTQWNVLNISATMTHLLRTDGTDLSWGAFNFADLGTTPTILSEYGISDTKANFDTACSDGNFMYIGDAPTAHSHGAISNTGHIGVNPNLPLITGTAGIITTGTFSTSANTFCEGNDSRLSDARTPTAHASSHISSGGDTIALFATASTVSGLVPGSNSAAATHFLNATGAWSVPAGGGTPGGSNTHVQFNDSGSFGGSANLVWSGSILTVNSGITATNIGIGQAASSSYGVYSTHAGTPGWFRRALTTAVNGTPYASMALELSTTSTISGGLNTGGFFYFKLTDSSGGPYNMGAFGVMSDDDATTGKLQFYSYYATERRLRMTVGADDATSTYAELFSVNNSGDVELRFFQNVNSRAIIGWDASADSGTGGLNLQVGTVLTATPAIFIGNQNHVAIGSQTDDADYEFHVTGDIYATGTVDIGGTGAGRLYVYDNTSAAYTAYFDQNHATGHGIRVDIDATSGTTYTLFRGYRDGTKIAELRSDGDWWAHNFIHDSDRRLKDIYQTVDDGLDIAMKLNPVTYRWKDKRDDDIHIGFVAQEVQMVRSELVKEGSNGFLSLAYGQMSALAIAGVQGLNHKVDSIEDKLRKEIVDLRIRVKQLENA